jgi:hypothetical protein
MATTRRVCEAGALGNEVWSGVSFTSRVPEVNWTVVRAKAASKGQVKYAGSKTTESGDLDIVGNGHHGQQKTNPFAVLWTSFSSR